ncbi:MAG: murein biosynthesis integral membrane protein MurJ [Desulfobacteraceae bacterium]|nr:MAG: murein biosynthesis integral membrane protein MurJ [Desulfobacteraceae bacterium]
MPEHEKRVVTKAVAVLGSATLLSRILGFVRDIVIAWYFGAGLGSDAFFVAFRIPNLFRRLFAEGSLSISFIPVFAEYLTKQGKNEADRLAGSAARLLSLILIVAVIFGIILSPLIVRLIAPGFSDTAGKYTLTVSLTRIMFPYLFFICLVALFTGILNVLGHFAAPAFAPAILNISMIAALLFIPSGSGEPAKFLAVGVLVGGFLQLAVQIPFLIKKGVYFGKSSGIYHPGLKEVGTLMLPAIFGAAVYQINILIGTLLASFLPEGSVSYLYYADRLVQLPLGIFAISAATAIFPALSRQASGNEMEAFRETFDYSLRIVMFITFPCMIGLIVLREPIVALLFKRGEFDAQTAALTAQALLYYSTGLWAFASVRIIVSVYYALRDTRTPVITALISFLANVVLSLLLMKPLKHGGLALATSLSSMLNVVLLLLALDIKIGPLMVKRLKESVYKIVTCSLIMGGIVYALASCIMPVENLSFGGLLSGVTCCILTGIISYAVLSFLIKSNEIKSLIALAGRGK